MKKVLLKDTIKEIKNTYKKFLSIMIMALLGVGFFVGIRAASPDMEATLDKYFDDADGFDIRVVSTLGLTNGDIEEIKQIDGVKEVEAVYDKDVIMDINDVELVLNVMQLPENINQIKLIDGVMPSNENECVVESRLEKSLGKTIKLEEREEDKILKNTELKVVGIVESPLYIASERGNSKLGSGKIDAYIYIPKTNIDSGIYTTIYVTVESAKQLEAHSKKYENLISKVKNDIKEISEERENARYNEITEEANKKLEDATNELNEEKTKAEKEIKDAENNILNAEKELNDNKIKADNEFTKAEKQLKNAEEMYETGKVEANSKKIELEDQNKILKENLVNLQTGIDTIKVNYIYADDVAKAVLDVQLEELAKQEQGLKTGMLQIEDGIKKIDTELESGKKQIESNKNKLENEKKSVYKKINNGKKELEDAKVTLNENKIEFEEKILDAENKILDAKEKIDEIKQPKWYVLDRKTANAGYALFSQDAESIASIGKVFPIVFFVVATLISLTSMTRMIDEQRVQIGTLKSLGYGKLQIASKYIIYASIATFLGSVIGISIGLTLLPSIVWLLYSNMYQLPKQIVLNFNTYHVAIGIVIIGLCIVGGAIYASFRKLKYNPAKLMRPKAPASGKRVLLERMPFIWKRLKFTQKVTIRNIFRYKKRFLMTILGICGSTALIVVGFGLKDSISQVLPIQYNEIFNYQASVGLKEDLTEGTTENLQNRLMEQEEIKGINPINMQAGAIINGEIEKEVQLVVAKDTQNFSDFIKLHNNKNKEKYELTDETVIITEKIARVLNIKIGDSILVKNEDEIEKQMIVGGITENYVQHYIYMKPEVYEKTYEKPVKTNRFLLKMEMLDDLKEQEISEALLKNDEIATIQLNSAVIAQMSDGIDGMDYVLIILIVSAGLLAFVVLYNLSNVNISERIRELATIKVLGFYHKEVYSYVTRETILLTIIGILLGLVGGYFLNYFVMQTAEQEMLMFPKLIQSISYLYATIIIVFFTLLVNRASYFVLKKINMIESLKSIE